MKYVSGNILDVCNKRLFQGIVRYEDKIITEIIEKPVESNYFITPGLIDAHVHIESSMLTPQNFAETVVRHGTVALISDPHEIANVLGLDGVMYMIKNAESAPVKFFFGAPSCVPATSYENSGASISHENIDYLFRSNHAHFLSEMMNYPGVIQGDPYVMGKIKIAEKYKRVIDGHAPGLRGKDLSKYINAGILTDHECVNREEAIEKIKGGMNILIREGSAAKNFKALFSLIDLYPDRIMFCSDDLHPDDLLKGHINLMVKRALNKSENIFNVFRACTYNPVMHYNLNAGLIRIGDAADFAVFNNMSDLEVHKTIIDGEVVYEKGRRGWSAGKQTILNNFHAKRIHANDLIISEKGKAVKIIHAYDGELVTGTIVDKPLQKDNRLIPDIVRDYLKISVVNRYVDQKPSLGFIHGFGLKKGAIAGSIAHDSHNIIGIGTNDEALIEVINWVLDHKGGIAVSDDVQLAGLPLPIAGIISQDKASTVAEKYVELNRIVKNLGCTLHSPFMTLSFMALLVIPELKLSDKGLFDGKEFSLTSLYVQ